MMTKSTSHYLMAPAGRKPLAQASITRASTRRTSILNQQIQDGLPLRHALPLSALLVGLMTWGLFHLQLFLMEHDHVSRVRPFGISYLIPIIIMTAFAGRRAGWFTLLLSVLALSLAMISLAISHRTVDFVELLLLTCVGSLVVTGVDAMQHNRMMFADITDAPQTEVILDAVRHAVCAVPSAGEVHNCVFRRRGFDIYVDLDFYLDSGVAASGLLTLPDITQTVAAVENAVYQAHPLIYQVRARLLTPPATYRDSLSS